MQVLSLRAKLRYSIPNCEGSTRMVKLYPNLAQSYCLWYKKTQYCLTQKHNIRSPALWLLSPETEPEIKLEGRLPRWSLPILVVKCHSQLDQLEQVHIALEQLILVVGGTLELPNWFSYHSRKLCVLWEQRNKTYIPFLE